MLLNKKYIIGTHVMFYEVEMISEFVESIYDATNGIENLDNIMIDFCFNFLPSIRPPSRPFEKYGTKKGVL